MAGTFSAGLPIRTSIQSRKDNGEPTKQAAAMWPLKYTKSVFKDEPELIATGRVVFAYLVCLALTLSVSWAVFITVFLYRVPS